ncbi:MAG: PIG-L family deacetylase, partial [Syntrophomonadaceae bacterium]
MARILVLAPHPDDDIIGCGGSIANLTAQGHEVVILYLTSGESGSLEMDPAQLARTREEEARRAGQLLGVR